MSYTDSQMKRVYAAEREAFTDTEFHKTISAADVGELISSIWTWTKNRVDPAPYFEVSNRKGNGAAHYTPWKHRITFSPQAMNPWIVIHEVTHAIERNGAFHGPEFCATYLKVVERFLGFDARERLGAAFRKHKVRTTGKSRARKKGTGPKRETKRAKANRLAKAAGLEIVADGWNRHYYELRHEDGDKLGRDGWTHHFYGLDEVMLGIENHVKEKQS